MTRREPSTASETLRLRGQGISLAIVVALAIVPSLLGHLGDPPGGWLPLPSAPQSFLALLRGGAIALALATALFAAVRAVASRQREILVLAALLPWVAALAGLEALRSGSDLASPDLLAWTASRLLLAAGLLVAALAIDAEPARSPRKSDRALALGVAGAGFATLALTLALGRGGGGPRLVDPDRVVSRPYDLLALVLFAAAGLTALYRGLRRGELRRGAAPPGAQPARRTGLVLALAALPSCLAEVETLLATPGTLDASFVLVPYLCLLAYLLLFAGLVLDHLAVVDRDHTAQIELVSTQEHLSQQTMELERTGAALARQQAENERMESTLRMLRNAVETMSVGVGLTDDQGKILYVNQATARIHGYEPEELLGQSTEIFTAGLPDNAPPPAEMEQGKPWSRERIDRTQDGGTVPVRLVSSWVHDPAGRREGLVTLCEDIREQRQAEEALARRDRILSAIGFAAERFLSATDWEPNVAEVLERLGLATGVDLVSIASFEPASGGPEFNNRWLSPPYAAQGFDVTNWRRIVQRSVFSHWPDRLREVRVLAGSVGTLPPAERAVLEARGIASFAAVAIPVQQELRGTLSLESQDPDRQWSTAEVEALRAAARTLGAALERQGREQALAASEANYRELLEGANDMIQSVAPDGRFEFVNRAWRETLGFRPEEVATLSLWDVVHPSYHQYCREMLAGVLQGQEMRRTEVVFLTRSGTEVGVEGHLSALAGGDRPRTLGIFRDISERLRIDRLKSELISTVSHELRTPLTSIIAALGLLQSGKLTDQPGRSSELLAVAHRNSLRLLQLINDVLDLQKLAAGKMSFDLRPLPMRGIVQEALRGIQVVADARQIALKPAIQGEDLWVLGDEARAIQVLNNLLSNAIKFSSVGGEVEVGGFGGAGRVVVYVKDWGPGIPLEFQHRLFDQFTQVQSLTLRQSGGSGLGLSIVKRLVEAMSGTVWCDSEPGSGATFFVELPAATPDGAPAPSPAPRSAAADPGPRRPAPSARAD